MTSPIGIGQGSDEFYDTNDNGLIMEVSPPHNGPTDGECVTCPAHVSVMTHFSDTPDSHAAAIYYTLT